MEVSEEHVGDYWWHALAKGMKLLRGRRWTAVGVFAIHSLFGGALSYLVAVCQSWDLFYWDRNPWIEILLVGVPVLMCPFVTLMSNVSMSVVYASCKAFHSETIAEHANAPAILVYSNNRPLENDNTDFKTALIQEKSVSYTIP